MPLTIQVAGEKPLRGKLAIVTGGGRGIGRATAIRLAEAGCDVAITGRTDSYLIYTSEKIRGTGRECLWGKTDVSKSDEVKNFVEQVETAFRRIDILVNNAEVAIAKPLFEFSEEEWDSVVDTNLKSIFLMCKSVLPSMMSQGSGIIINVASVAGRAGMPRLSVYSATKAGVMRLSESLGKEMGRGIRVYGVCPAGVDTDMNRELVPWQRALLLEPEDIAERILYLCLNESVPSGTCIDVVR